MRTPVAPAVFLTGLSVIALSAQAPPAPAVERVLDRMADYFEAYEAQLTAITANEWYEQQEQRLILPSASRVAPPAPRVRKLESEVAFVRLPGSGEWAGFRDVRRVDGRRITGNATRLTELMSRGSSTFEQAVAMTVASSKHNLGTDRTPRTCRRCRSR